MSGNTPETNPQDYNCIVTDQNEQSNIKIKNKKSYGVTVLIFVLLILFFIIFTNTKSLWMYINDIEQGRKQLNELSSSMSKNTVAIIISFIMCLIFIIMYSINEL